VPHDLLRGLIARLVPRYPTGRQAWFDLPYVRDDGPRKCRCCFVILEGRRRTWCSDACVNVWCLVGFGDPADVVFARDRGVCAACGVDCIAASRAIRSLHRVAERRIPKVPDLPWCAYSPRKWDDPDRAAARAEHKRQVEERSAAILVWIADRLQVLRPEFARFPAKLSHTWEADHIVPVVEGGGNELANLRTLCTPCHRDATRTLAGRRAVNERRRKWAEKRSRWEATA
jgi:5-methylcytosine-specific restriction endonuclease McrA